MMKTTIFKALRLDYNLILSCIISLMICGACTEIFEPYLGDDTVVLITPLNNFTSPLLTHTFWWDEVDDAEEYNFQIVSLSLNISNEIIFDTIITDYNITYALSPGSYQWGVCAKNSSSKTVFTSNILVIDSSSLLSNDSIQLMYPLKNDTTNINSQIFKWQGVNNVDTYQFNLYYDLNLVHTVKTSIDSIKIQLQWGEGSYDWEVKGLNEVTCTVYSKRNFFVDITPPQIPTLIAPYDNIEVKDTIQLFEWRREVDYGSSIKDSLLIYTNHELTEIKIKELIEDKQYEIYLEPGVYYWQVRSIDAAANLSEYSQLRKLTVKSQSIIEEELLLQYPIKNDTINKSLIAFSWLQVNNANGYNLNLYYDSDLVYTTYTIAESTEIDLIWGEGSYKWEVRAQNDISNTEYSIRSFFIDTTAPSIPILLTPDNNIESSETFQHFSWNKPEDFGSSLKYNILICSDPEFAEVLVDKVVSDTYFEINLEPGEYYWRVQSIDVAGNIGIYTQMRKIVINLHPISEEEVLLLYPLENDTTNETLITFKWLQVNDAIDYDLNLYYNSDLVYNINTTEELAEIDLIWGDGAYKWEVKANNNYSSTVYSQREFYLDSTSPETSILISPINNAESSNKLQLFSWDRIVDNGSSIRDSLFIYNDLSMTSIMHRKLLNTTEYEYNLETGEFFWRVRSIDAAGNLSDYSPLRKIMILDEEK